MEYGGIMRDEELYAEYSKLFDECKPEHIRKINYTTYLVKYRGMEPMSIICLQVAKKYGYVGSPEELEDIIATGIELFGCFLVE